MAAKKEKDDKQDLDLNLDGENPPKGTNDLSSFAMFQQRKKYKNSVYPSSGVPLPVDLWYDDQKKYWGRVGKDGDSLVLQENYLEQLESLESQNVFALDFVSNAFKDFRKRYVFLNKRDVGGTPFQFLRPTKGWRSAPADYNTYMDGVFNSFSNNFMTRENRDSTLLTFEDFIRLFKKFVEQGESAFPITLSKFILSPRASPQSSGLIIELTTDPHGNDEDKYEHFIKNINFECYANTAQEFGFKIDKNYPGRLIADVESPVMTRMGDSNIPPSEGGRGYMLRYPKRPPPYNISRPTLPASTPPTPPEPIQNRSNPWRNGDIVEIIVVVPHNKARPGYAPVAGGQESFFILSNYTAPNDIIHPAGRRSKTIITSTGEESTEYSQMLEYFEGYGTPVKYTLKILDDNPQSNLGGGGGGGENIATGRYVGYHMLVSQIRELLRTQNPNAQTQGTDVLGNLNVRRSMLLGKVLCEIISVSHNFPGGMGGATADVNGYDSYYDFNYTDLQTLASQNIQYDQYGFVEGQVGDRTGLFLEVPVSALHLSPNSSLNGGTATLNRIQDYFSYADRLSQYQAAKQSYNDQWQKRQLHHQEELYNWRQLSASWAAKQDHYQNSPRLTFDNFVSRRYTMAYLEDINLLKEICMQFYYSYSSQRPKIFNTEIVKCQNVYTTRHTTLTREQISKEKILQEYSDKFWLKFYIFIRNFENKTKIPPQKFNYIVSQAVFLLDKHHLQTALFFVNSEMKKFN